MNFSAVENGVVVVAHPDDEVMWAGGMLARYRGPWTVICCSIPRTDPIRAWKFFDACRVLGAKAKLLPFTEANPNEGLRNLEHLNLSEYDCIVTHNDAGEYGHVHHVTLHNYIVRSWKDKTLTFGYHRSGTTGDLLYLTNEEWDTKHRALQCYDHRLPYGNGSPPKWEALLHRYQTVEGFDLKVEGYDRA